MHDSGWLVFNFDSEMDMLKVLNGGPYSVHGRLLILKIMPEFFDFDTSDMLRMPVWIRFPNLPLQCWFPLCLQTSQCDRETASLGYPNILHDSVIICQSAS